MRHLIPLSVTALLIFASSAHAEPIVGVPFSATALIVCDDKSQVQELFDGSKQDDGKGLIEVYNKWHDVVDAEHEPTCNLQPLAGAMIKSVEDVGVTQTPNAKYVHTWLIELGRRGGATDWALYGEVQQQESPKSESSLRYLSQGEPI
jgi:hypothetical protein